MSSHPTKAKSYLWHSALSLVLGSTVLGSGCQSEQKTRENTQFVIQASLDAEKVKELASTTAELKKIIEELKTENESLRRQLASQTKAVGPVALAPTKPKSNGQKSPDLKATPTPGNTKETEELKEAVTGGSSFK
jgi:predicted RNase H-like nuclease (RuvC/YqgF family)